MLSYIANIDTSEVIQEICKRKNILILNTQEREIDIKQYVKETKINFNLIKYLVIDLSMLKNSKEEIIECIYEFSKLYTKARIVFIASGYDDQDILLTNMYDLEFYNIINEVDKEQIKEKLNIALGDGIQKNDAKKFKKREEVKQKESKVKVFISKIKIKGNKKEPTKKVKEDSADMPSNRVYLFSLLIEAITRLVKLVCYITIFCLTSVGLTVLVNPELRELVFQVFGLK